MQHIAEHSTHFVARKVISNFEPCILFVLAKTSTLLASHGDYVESDGRFVSVTARLRVLLYERASEHAEAMISCVVVAGFASTTNDRVVARLKVDPKLRTPSSGTRGWPIGSVRSLAVSLQQGGIGIGAVVVVVVELVTCRSLAI
jgi:hypothetical protein